MPIDESGFVSIGPPAATSEKGFVDVPDQDFQVVDERGNNVQQNNIDRTVLGNVVDWFGNMVDTSTRTVRRDTRENLIRASESTFGRHAGKVGSGIMTFFERGYGAWLAGRNILVRSAKNQNTADLITPYEVIGNWDFRDPELEEAGIVAADIIQSIKGSDRGDRIPGALQTLQMIYDSRGDKSAEGGPITTGTMIAQGAYLPGTKLRLPGASGIPGISQRDADRMEEQLNNWLSEEGLRNLQETPFSLFGLPMKFDGTIKFFKGLLNKEVVLSEGESNAMISNEQVVRAIFTIGDDPLLPALALGGATRGVRGIRWWTVGEGAEEVSESISRVANGINRSRIRMLDDAAPKRGINLNEIPNEVISDVTAAALDLRGTNPTRIWQSIAEGVGKLDPTNADDVTKFRTFVGEIANGTPTAGAHEGIGFSMGLDYGLSDHNFDDVIDALSTFSDRAGLTELGDLRRFKLADTLAGANITHRPAAIFPDGRVLYYNARRGEDFTPLKNTNMRLIYRLMTGKSFEQMAGEEVAYVTSRVIKEAEDTVPTLHIKFRFPDWSESSPGLRERLADQMEESINVIERASTASRMEMSVKTITARRMATEKAELEVYRAFGVTGDVDPSRLRVPPLQRVKDLQRIRSAVNSARPSVTDLPANYEKVSFQINKAAKIVEDALDTITVTSDNRPYIERIRLRLKAMPNEVSGRTPKVLDGNTVNTPAENAEWAEEIFGQLLDEVDALIADTKQLIDHPEQINRHLSPDERASIITAGRARVNRGLPSDATRIQRQILKRTEKYANEAQNAAATKLQDDTYDIVLQMDIGAPSRKGTRRTISIGTAEVTGMTAKGRDLRTTINSKALLRGTHAVVDQYTHEVKFFAKASTKGAPPKTMLEPLDVQLARERAAAELNPTIGNVVDETTGMRGVVDDTLEGILDGKTKTSEVFESTVPTLKGSGGGVPPVRRTVTDPIIPGVPAGRVKDMGIFGWIRDPEVVFKGTKIYELLAQAEYANYRTQETIATLVNGRLGWLKAGSANSRRMGRILAGKATDVDGTAIKLTEQEEEGVRLIKGVMDDMMTQGGHRTSDDVREYFGTLLQSGKGPKAKIDPALLDSPSTGNQFFNHMLPERVGNDPGPASWDIVDMFRAFTKASSQNLHMEPALLRAKEIADEVNLPSMKRRYLNTLSDRIRGKPLRHERIIDEGIANSIENMGLSFMFKELDTGFNRNFFNGKRGDFSSLGTRASLGLTRALYRGLLGGSVGFMLKNSSQIINTAADVGPGAALQGLARMTHPTGRNAAKQQRLMREFNGLFEEVNIGSRIDDLIFKPVQWSEFQNRGVAFHAGMAAEARSLGMSVGKGMAEPEVALRLLAAGHTVAQRTQFVYGVLGRSPVFGTIFGRVLGQFMTFPIKQSEFLVDMARNDKTGFLRYLGLAGYYSRLMSEGGIDPTSFIGFGYLPQGIEKGVPVPLAAGMQGMYHLFQLSNAAATNDFERQEMMLSRVASDMLHLLPAGLQMEKTFTALQRAESLKISNETGDIIRHIGTRESFLQFFGLPTMDARVSRDFAQDMFRQQKLANFQRKHIVQEILNHTEELREQGNDPFYASLNGSGYLQKLVAQAVAWGLPITDESVRRAAERRELSSYLRRMMHDKQLGIQFFNRYIQDMPEESEKFNFKPRGQ